MQQNPNLAPEEDNFTFRKAYADRMADVSYLWTQKFKIGLACIVGALLGLLIAWKWPVSYTARLSFVVEESKGSGGGLLSSLAGSFGFDLGTLGGSSGGVLAGDNVLQLLVSQRMLKETFLTPFDSRPNYTLADRYADVYKLKEDWRKKETDPVVMFPPTPEKYTRLQDSLLHIILEETSEKRVSVGKPDKKLSFFELNATMKDDRLASLFTQRLIDQATKFYIETKTKSARLNIEKLQHRADSIGSLLNRRTYSSAAATVLDANPGYVTATVNSEVQERDKRVMQTYYAEIIKNLEVSRTMLTQQTPTFQVVDSPELPLKKNRLRYKYAGLGGILAVGGIYCLFLLSEKNKRLRQSDHKTYASTTA